MINHVESRGRSSVIYGWAYRGFLPPKILDIKLFPCDRGLPIFDPFKPSVVVYNFP